MSIASLSSIADPFAAPALSALQAVSGSASSSSASATDASNGASFSSILAGLGSAANPLNFISTPANSPPVDGQSTGVLGELTSLLSSI
jgi:hypothetical protein